MNIWLLKLQHVVQNDHGKRRFQPPLSCPCSSKQQKDEYILISIILVIAMLTFLRSTGLGKRVVSRLRELAPHGKRESGGGIHAT